MFQVPVCPCVFALFIDCPLSSSMIFSLQLHPYCRSEHGFTGKHKTQLMAISSAQVALGIFKSLGAPNPGPLVSAPFTFFFVLFVA